MRLPNILGLTLLVGLALTACGDDDEPNDGGATPEVTAPMDGRDEAGAAGGETVTVEIGEFVFEPTPVEVGVGDSVVWANVHDQPHTASGNGDQPWDTANIAPGATSDPVVFDEAGTYTYICGLHPFMEGTVDVSA